MPARVPWWTWACPLFAWVILLITAFAGTGGGFLQASAGIILIPTVCSAVHMPKWLHIAPASRSAPWCWRSPSPLVLYGRFVFIQTVRHRDYFLPLEAKLEEAHAPPPSNATTAVSAGLLLVALAAVGWRSE